MFSQSPPWSLQLEQSALERKPRQPPGGERASSPGRDPHFIYLFICVPAAQLFIFKSNIISLGRHQEGKKVKLIWGPFQVGSQLPAASGKRRPSDLLPASGCPGFCGGFAKIPLHTRPATSILHHIREAARGFKVAGTRCNGKRACFARLSI